MRIFPASGLSACAVRELVRHGLVIRRYSDSPAFTSKSAVRPTRMQLRKSARRTPSPCQRARRAQWRPVKNLWDTLDPTEKTAWRDFALGFPLTDRCGETYYLTAYRMFCHVNGPLASFGPEYLQVAPPVDLDPPPEDVAFSLFYATLSWHATPQLAASHDAPGDYGFELWSDPGLTLPLPWPARKSQLLYRTPGEQPPDIPGLSGGGGGGGGSAAIAVGEYYDDITGIYLPLALYSSNGGLGWVGATHPSTPDGATLYAGAVSGSRAIAVGTIYDAGAGYNVALLWFSANGGAAWAFGASPVGGINASLNGCAIIDSVAIAVGEYRDEGSGLLLPLLLISTNGGGYWEITASPYGETQSTLLACALDGSTGLAVGRYFNSGLATYQPLIFRSADGGASWYIRAAPEVGEDATLYGVTISGETAITVGSAYDADLGYYTPIVFRSVDGGISWESITPPYSATDSSLTSISISGSQVVAVGSAYDGGTGDYICIAAYSGDSGATWTMADSPYSASDSSLYGVTLSGAAAIAVGSAYDVVLDDYVGITVVSTDGGVTWDALNVPASGVISPLYGCAASVGAPLPIGLLHSWRWYGARRFGSCPPILPARWAWVYNQAVKHPVVWITGTTINLANGVGRDVHVLAYLEEP